MDVTLFELHLEDATFNAPFASDQESTQSGTAGTPTDSSGEDDSASKILAPIIGLAVLLGLAVGVRRWRQADGEKAVEPDEIAIEEA